ncbi:12439_t:CDS:1, partial [Gigaspora rosea]
VGQKPRKSLADMTNQQRNLLASPAPIASKNEYRGCYEHFNGRGLIIL